MDSEFRGSCVRQNAETQWIAALYARAATHRWIMQQGEKFYGKYRGKVADNKDPLKLGRLSVLVPAVGDVPLKWAMPCVPYAGKKVGFFVLPPVDANVWVEFESGDPNQPVWTGCFWGKGELPVDPAEATTKMFKTEKVTAQIDDKKQELKLELDTGSGKFTVTMDKKGIKLDCKTANVTITKEEVLVKKAPSEVSVKGDGVTVKNGGASVKVAPAAVDVKNGAASVKVAAAAVGLKNGAASVDLSPASVSINKGALEVM